MSIITITIANRDFRLSCPDENRSALLLLAEKLDLELSKIKQSNPSASFELSLVMLALGLIDNQEKQRKIDGGAVLEEANEDFQKILTSIFDELKIVARNLE